MDGKRRPRERTGYRTPPPQTPPSEVSERYYTESQIQAQLERLDLQKQAMEANYRDNIRPSRDQSSRSPPPRPPPKHHTAKNARSKPAHSGRREGRGESPDRDHRAGSHGANTDNPRDSRPESHPHPPTSRIEPPTFWLTCYNCLRSKPFGYKNNSALHHPRGSCHIGSSAGFDELIIDIGFLDDGSISFREKETGFYWRIPPRDWWKVRNFGTVLIAGMINVANNTLSIYYHLIPQEIKKADLSFLYEIPSPSIEGWPEVPVYHKQIEWPGLVLPGPERMLEEYYKYMYELNKWNSSYRYDRPPIYGLLIGLPHYKADSAETSALAMLLTRHPALGQTKDGSRVKERGKRGMKIGIRERKSLRTYSVLKLKIRS